MEQSQLILKFQFKERPIYFPLSSSVLQLNEFIIREEQLGDEQIPIITYQGIILKPDKSLNDYSITNKSLLDISIKLIKSRGGGGYFEAPSITNDNLVIGKLDPYEPNLKHRSVKQGLNLKYFCNQQTCNCDVYIQIGLGYTDIGRIQGKQFCSKCNQKLLGNQLKNFVFSQQCFWKFEFQASNSTDANIGEGTNDNNDNYATFKEVEQVQYSYLYIISAKTKQEVQQYKFPQ